MKAPQYERAEMLGVAIRRATDELSAPIDRIEVVGSRVNCWAGSRRVSLAYSYAQGGRMDPAGRFQPLPGSGSWDVVVVPRANPPRNVIAKALARLLKSHGA